MNLTLGFLVNRNIIDKYEIIQLYGVNNYVSCYTSDLNSNIEELISKNKDRLVLSISSGIDGGLIIHLNEVTKV